MCRAGSSGEVISLGGVYQVLVVALGIGRHPDFTAQGGHPALPFLYSLADLVIGLILLVVLIIALVLSLQLADAIVLRASGDHLIDVHTRLAALNSDPASSQNWWIYVTLFSTLIPSALNLFLGTISLTFVSRRSSRQDLIRRIRRLTDKGRETTRFRISVRLMLLVFIGAMMAGLIPWGSFALLASHGTIVLHRLL